MGHRNIPVERARELKASGLSWKEVARTLKTEGYPLFLSDSLSRACVVDKQIGRLRFHPCKPPVDLIEAFRTEGRKWKEIPALLHSMGYPLWHYTTLCNATKGR